MELDYPEVHIDDVSLFPLKGSFQVIRSSNGLYVTGELRSLFETECSRCLDSTKIPLTIEMDELFYYPESAAPPGDFGVGEDGFIDLGPLVRQLSLLGIPLQPFCRPECKGLCAHCGQNLNLEDCDCETENIDPRLESLRHLLDSQAKIES